MVQLFPYDSYEEGVANAKSNLLWEGAGHTSVVYTNDAQRAEYAGEELPVCRVLVNQAGGAASGRFDQLRPARGRVVDGLLAGAGDAIVIAAASNHCSGQGSCRCAGYWSPRPVAQPAAGTISMA